MTLEEVGAYMLLLCYHWKDGSLPDDDTKLAIRSRAGIRWPMIRESVMARFVKRNDIFISMRLTSERKKYDEMVEKKKIAGSKGGKAKRDRDL